MFVPKPTFETINLSQLKSTIVVIHQVILESHVDP